MDLSRWIPDSLRILTRIVCLCCLFFLLFFCFRHAFPASDEAAASAGASDTDAGQSSESAADNSDASPEEKKYIKWVDFNVTAQALTDALRYDVDSYRKTPHYQWIELLACLAAKKRRRLFPLPHLGYGPADEADSGRFFHGRINPRSQILSLL